MTNEQLAYRIRAEENTADNMLQLWQQNRAFIGKIALKYSKYAEMDDLKQEGYIALCEAVRHYDTDYNVPFINYAAYHIKQRMQRYIEDNGNCIRIPSYMYNQVRKYKKIVSDFEKLYSKKPTEAEMRSFLGVGKETLESIKQAVLTGQMQSLSTPVGEEENFCIEDTISSGEDLEEEVTRRLDRERMCQDLLEMVDSLPDQQREVIRMRYQEGKTLREVGEIQGRAIEGVCQIEKNAFRKMRSSRKCEKLRSYHEVYLSAAPVRHVGVRQFQRTWESEVEREALRWAERELGIRDRD